MAEITAPANTKQKGGKRSTKKSTRVDLTPMVDLGFLLITFFVFTTSISHPNAMALIMPKDKDIKDSMPTPEGKTINLLLAANDQVFYYNGSDAENIHHTGFSADGLRAVFLDKKLALRNTYGVDTGMVVLIKPTPASSYANLVNTLDEITICNIGTYVLMDASAEELDKIKH